MSDDRRSSGSNAGVVIVIALLVVGLMCCGGGAFLGLGFIQYNDVERYWVWYTAKLAATIVVVLPIVYKIASTGWSVWQSFSNVSGEAIHQKDKHVTKARILRKTKDFM